MMKRRMMIMMMMVKMIRMMMIRTIRMMMMIYNINFINILPIHNVFRDG